MGEADWSGQIRGASTLDVYGETSKWITEFALDMGYHLRSKVAGQDAILDSPVAHPKTLF